MPVKRGELCSNDYNVSKEFVLSSAQGETITLFVDNYKRVQKYLYEIGLKQKPRREFSTKKLSDTQLRATRII